MTTRHWPVIPARNIGMAAAFGLAYAALRWLYQASRGAGAEHLLIDVLTVRPCAWLIQWLTPAEQVAAVGHRLVSPLAKLNILNGCEGTESLFLLAAAIAAYPSGLGRKCLGLLQGALLVYGLNQARIVALYYAVRHDRELFQLLHGILAPTLIILCGCLFFVSWAQAANRRAVPPPPA